MKTFIETNEEYFCMDLLFIGLAILVHGNEEQQFFFMEKEFSYLETMQWLLNGLLIAENEAENVLAKMVNIVIVICYTYITFHIGGKKHALQCKKTNECC